MPKSKRSRCAHCNTKKLILVPCKECDKKYCVAHIHDFVHNCPALSKKNKIKLIKVEPKKVDKI